MHRVDKYARTTEVLLIFYVMFCVFLSCAWFRDVEMFSGFYKKFKKPQKYKF